MPRIVKAEVAQDLTDLFIPLESISLSPTSISDELLLTHPLLPGSHRFRSSNGQTGAGGAGSLTVGPFGPNAVVGAPERYWYVFACDIRTVGDVAVRVLSIFLRITTGAANFDAALVSAVQPSVNGRICVPRPFLIPPNGVLVGVAETIGAGGVLTLAVNFVEHKLLDPMPQV